MPIQIHVRREPVMPRREDNPHDVRRNDFGRLGQFAQFKHVMPIRFFGLADLIDLLHGLHGDLAIYLFPDALMLLAKSRILALVVFALDELLDLIPIRTLDAAGFGVGYQLLAPAYAARFGRAKVSVFAWRNIMWAYLEAEITSSLSFTIFPSFL